MIYRADDCGVFGSHDDSVVVWISASSTAEARAKLPKLLSVGWGVDEDQICFGNVLGELELEHRSVQPNAAGDRRWHESGARGDWPMYHRSSELVLLRHRDLCRLYDAKAAAQMHSRELAAACVRELDALSQTPGNDQRTREWRYDLISYENFAGQPSSYARERNAFAVPSASDVRRLRERHQLTQAGAADLVHVTVNAWQKWEQGVRKMDRRTWELLLYKLREEYL